MLSLYVLEVRHGHVLELFGPLFPPPPTGSWVVI